MSKNKLVPSTASYQHVEEWIKSADETVDPEDFTLDEDLFDISSVQENGGEGQGEEYGVTIRITEKATGLFGYVTFLAHYDSWNGAEWEDKFISEPEEVTYIEYQGRKKDGE
jgi:hypothetical protein